jgi:hypothetical protein
LSNISLAKLKFKEDDQRLLEHTLELERKAQSRLFVLKLDGSPVWEHQAGLLGFEHRFPLMGCQCSVQAITLGALYTRYRLSMKSQR